MNKNTLLIILITIVVMSFIWKISEQQQELSGSIKTMQDRLERIDTQVDNAITSKQMSGHLITVRGNLNKILKILEEGLQK